MDADVLIVGGGIAGLSAAHFARRAGREVTLVDLGMHCASALPIALVNPLRGHDGRLVRNGVAGMRATFELVDALRADGNAIEHGRGLHRPLIDLADEFLHEGHWRARLGSSLECRWHPEAPSSLGLRGSTPSLFLPEPGWIAAPQLLTALRVSSGATVVHGEVVALRPARDGGSVRLSNETVISARAILWCGGAWGAADLDRRTAGDALADGIYKPGSLMASPTTLTSVPMAFGMYAVPTGPDSTLVGPTREGSTSVFLESPAPPEVVTLLQDRVTRTFGSTLPLEPIWRGVRLARLSSGAHRALEGVATLTALDSRGFLMAPLLAAQWARSL